MPKIAAGARRNGGSLPPFFSPAAQGSKEPKCLDKNRVHARARAHSCAHTRELINARSFALGELGAAAAPSPTNLFLTTFRSMPTANTGDPCRRARRHGSPVLAVGMLRNVVKNRFVGEGAAAAPSSPSANERAFMSSRVCAHECARARACTRFLSRHFGSFEPWAAGEKKGGSEPPFLRAPAAIFGNFSGSAPFPMLPSDSI